MYEFKINLDEEDYYIFSEYYLFHSVSGKKALLSYRLSCLFYFFTLVVIYCIADSDLNIIFFLAISLTIYSIFLIGNSKKKFLKSMVKRIETMKEEGRLPYNNEAVLKFDDESIYEIAPDTESKVKYSLVEKIDVTENAIYIYFSSIQAYIVPITVFSEEMEKVKFLEFIYSKVDILRLHNEYNTR